MGRRQKIKRKIPQIHSPCMRICLLNKELFCKGCLRHQSEIRNWPILDDDIRQEILDDIPNRILES